MDADTEATWALPPEAPSAALARRLVEAHCPALPAERLDTARLLVTELVSNAVRHGAGPVLLALAASGDRLRVGVEDDSPSMPVMVSAPVGAQGGHGLHLVADLASRWGVARRDAGRPGKRVWFELT